MPGAGPPQLSQAVPVTALAAKFLWNSRLRAWHVACYIRTQMMGRKHVAAVLSWFVVIGSMSAFAACGGTALNTDPGGSAAGAPTAGGNSVAGYGGTAGNGVNYSLPLNTEGGYIEPPGGYGGAIAPPGGYGGGVYDTYPPPTEPPCPVDLPAFDSACTSGPLICPYWSSCTSFFANCVGGHWQIANDAVSCAGGAGGADDESSPPRSGPLTCPTQAPTRGTPCYLPPTLASYTCDFPDAPGTCGGTKATCSSAGTWEVAGAYGCAGDSGI
jgi:hypothetical protein